MCDIAWSAKTGSTGLTEARKPRLMVSGSLARDAQRMAAERAAARRWLRPVGVARVRGHSRTLAQPSGHAPERSQRRLRTATLTGDLLPVRLAPVESCRPAGSHDSAWWVARRSALLHGGDLRKAIVPNALGLTLNRAESNRMEWRCGADFYFSRRLLLRSRLWPQHWVRVPTRST